MDGADDLYGLPLEEFVPARDALAKELRAGGDRAAADAVRGLAKPSAAAWVVNQAVRSQPSAARALWKAGDELIGTQERLLGGDASRDDLRAAAAAEREALAPLLDAARGLLSASGAGPSETALARAEETLHAAAIDPDARPDVAAGRLAKELRHVGLGAAPVAPASKPARSTAAPATPDRDRSAAAGPKRGRSAAATPDRDRSAAAAPKRDRSATPKRDRSAAPDRDRSAPTKRERVAAARELVDAARSSLDAVRDEADAARDEADAARDEAHAARDAMDAARAALDAARERERSARSDERDARRREAAARKREDAARGKLDEAEATLREAREA